MFNIQTVEKVTISVIPSYQINSLGLLLQQNLLSTRIEQHWLMPWKTGITIVLSKFDSLHNYYLTFHILLWVNMISLLTNMQNGYIFIFYIFHNQELGLSLNKNNTLHNLIVNGLWACSMNTWVSIWAKWFE